MKEFKMYYIDFWSHNSGLWGTGGGGGASIKYHFPHKKNNLQLTKILWYNWPESSCKKHVSIFTYLSMVAYLLNVQKSICARVWTSNFQTKSVKKLPLRKPNLQSILPKVSYCLYMKDAWWNYSTWVTEERQNLQ